MDQKDLASLYRHRHTKRNSLQSITDSCRCMLSIRIKHKLTLSHEVPNILDCFFHPQTGPNDQASFLRMRSWDVCSGPPHTYPASQTNPSISPSTRLPIEMWECSQRLECRLDLTSLSPILSTNGLAYLERYQKDL